MGTRVCKLCGETFDIGKHGQGSAKYCLKCRPLAKKLKDQRHTLRRDKDKLREYQVEYRPKQKIPCPECGKPMTPKSRWCRECYCKKAVELHLLPSGKQHHWYKNGKPKTSSGYIAIKCQNHPSADHNGYVAEHRLVMEKEIGHYLQPYELVHHLNGIRTDNRIQNLVIVSRHNHPNSTLLNLLRKRIRELEIELSQPR